MKKSPFLIIVLLLASLMACERLAILFHDNPDQPVTRAFTFGQPFELPFGKLARHETENVSITFTRVLEDSRCPINVNCVWEGNAKLKFLLQHSFHLTHFSLNTTLEPKDTTIADYSVSLTDLLPYPHSDSTYTDADYTAILIVNRK
ncbi:hypothetical protein JW960_24875 [candidate division KSB1 bacterium]|nr:hypothetical protein [candidate division KSB1 bacterium]